MIIDTHVHITSSDRDRYPFDPPDRQVERLSRILVTAEDLIGFMKEAGVHRAVLVQATPTHGYDNSYAADMAVQFPQYFSTVCCVNASRADALERLDYWIDQRNMGGVRLFNSMTSDDLWLDDPKCLALVERAGRTNTPVTLVSRHHELDRVRNVLERSPDVPIILDHLGYMPNLQPPPFPLSDEFYSMAAYSNLSLKFSAVNQWGVEQGTVPAEDYFKAIIDHFGPRRLMWGSNYPATRHKPYPELARMGAEPFGFLSEDERGLVLGGNALRFWPTP